MPQKVGMPWSPGLRLSMLIGVLIAGMLFGVFLSGTGVMGTSPRRPKYKRHGGSWWMSWSPRTRSGNSFSTTCAASIGWTRSLPCRMSHPGATINAGTYEGTFAGYIERAWVGHARLTAHSHQITTISIKVDGDTAVSEGYAMNSLHSEPTPPGQAPTPTRICIANVMWTDGRSGMGDGRSTIVSWSSTSSPPSSPTRDRSSSRRGRRDRTDPSYEVYP